MQLDMKEKIQEAIAEFISGALEGYDILDVAVHIDFDGVLLVVVVLPRSAIFIKSHGGDWLLGFDSDNKLFNEDEMPISLVDEDTITIAKETVKALNTFFYRGPDQ